MSMIYKDPRKVREGICNTLSANTLSLGKKGKIMTNKSCLKFGRKVGDPCKLSEI